MRVVTIPRADMAAVRAGDPDALLVALAELASRLMRAGGHALIRAAPAISVALEGGSAKAGVLAAGMDLRELLAQSPQGRKVLCDFGYCARS